MKRFLLLVFVPVLLAAGCVHAQNEAPPGATVSSLTSTDVEIKNGDVVLAGTIIRPAEPSGVGVVMLPGSGPATRDQIRPAAQELAARGAAVMIFDKRGSGASGGSWITSSLDDLAADANAAAALLREETGLTAIGFWGHSQGNWVAARASELGGAPAFYVAVSGGGVSPRENETNAYKVKVANLSSADQAAAAAFVEQYFQYLAGEISRAALMDKVEEVKDTQWYEQLQIGNILVSEKNRPNWQWVADYDPAARAAEWQFPTLVMLGGADRDIPLALTIADWNSQLAEGGNPASRIVVLPGREHHLRRGQGHGHGVSTDPVIWDTIGQWLEEMDRAPIAE